MESTNNIYTCNIAEAAKMSGLGQGYLRQLVRSGDLPCIRIGRRIRLRPEDIASWCRDHSKPYNLA